MTIYEIVGAVVLTGTAWGFGRKHAELEFQRWVVDMSQMEKDVQVINHEQMWELDYLQWFRQHADFGPATGDVIALLNEAYEQERGRKVPPAWRDE